MDEFEKWERTRKQLRIIFADLDFLTLIEVGKDLAAMLEYRARQVNSMLDHQEFNDLMKKEWPESKESSG